jgi:hypothetical protein
MSLVFIYAETENFDIKPRQVVLTDHLLSVTENIKQSVRLYTSSLYSVVLRNKLNKMQELP